MAPRTKTSAVPTPFEPLRRVLLALPPSGSAGFEGLIALALESASGIPYRIAGSGVQHGTDGNETFQSSSIAFECKRYEESVSRESVMSKLAELSARTDVDIWVLAATAPILAQLAADVESVASAQGLECVVLDWQSTASLPVLAVVVSLIPLATFRTFLSNSAINPALIDDAIDAIEVIRRDERFANHESLIKDVLTSSRAGFITLQKNNREYLKKALSSRELARHVFGQSLAPAADESGVLTRQKLEQAVIKHLASDTEGGTPLFVVGDEGVGKSWLVMNSWLSMGNPPALFFLPPERVVGIPSRDLPNTLISEMAAQCEGRMVRRERMSRRLDRWLRSGSSSRTPFVVYLDGINQHPGVDWARMIDELNSLVRQVGGRVVASSRTEFFNAYVANRLVATPRTLNVFPWTPEERDAVLVAKGLSPKRIATSVLSSLRNPRLLGLATELLSGEEIQSLEELSVGRLLFEHLRATSRDSAVLTPAHVLVARLSNHAETLLSRTSSSTGDDQHVFRDLEAVVEGLYFHPIAGDPSRYSLSEHGMRLALAFAFLDRLRTAERNNRSVTGAALALIDPVAALDDAPAVLTASLAVACADPSVSDAIRAATLIAFSETQNPDKDEFEPFAHLATRHLLPYLLAIKELALQGARQPNFSWVSQAILRASQLPDCWEMMKPHIRSWLLLHALDPAVRHFARPDGEVALADAREKLRENVALLSEDEDRLFNLIIEVDSDPTELHRICVLLLAGKPLAEFSLAISSFALAMSVQPGPSLLYDDLIWLGILNTTDWSAFRSEVHECASSLLGEDASVFGKWAAVTLLRMTGHPEDGSRAAALVRELRADLTGWAWRRNERFCSVDPCDPDAQRPENITNAIETLDSISADAVFGSFTHMSHDIDFDAVLPALARFELKRIANFINRFAEGVASRREMPLRQGIIGAYEHRAALLSNVAVRFFELRASVVGDPERQLRSHDLSFLSNLCLSIALPHVDGRRQLTEILRPAPDSSLFTNMVDVLDCSPVPAINLKRVLDDAISRDDVRAQCYILDFLHSGEIPTILEESVLLLCQSSVPVRIHALALILRRGSVAQLASFVASGWRYDQAIDKAEQHYGSALLVRAAKDSVVRPLEVLTRVSPEWHGSLATLSRPIAMRYAQATEAWIQKASRCSISEPNLDIFLDEKSSFPGGRVTISRKHVDTDPLSVMASSLGNDLDAFDKEAAENAAAFDRFRDQLQSESNVLALNPLLVEEARAIQDVCPGKIAEWADSLLKRGSIHPLLRDSLLAISVVLSETDDAIALQLIEACSKPSVVNVAHGLSRLTLLQRAVWSGRSARFRAVQTSRLDNTMSDHVLAMEVLAAQVWGDGEFLDGYIADSLRSKCPVRICRALMAAGYRDDDQGWDTVDYVPSSAGVIRDAFEAGRSAFQRNRWAKHWHRVALESETSLEFWRASVLLAKIVDVRADIWLPTSDSGSRWYRIYHDKLVSEIRRRIDRIRTKRERSLFGRQRPADYLLHASAPTV